MKPAFLALDNIESVISLSLFGGQYSWNHFAASGPEAAPSSSGGVADAVDIMYGTPQRAAARATPHSP